MSVSSSVRVLEWQELTFFKGLTNRQGQNPQSCTVGDFFASLQTAQIVLLTSVSLSYSSYMSGLLDAVAAGTKRQDVIALSQGSCTKMYPTQG